MANTLQAGFARVNITPPMGIHISGYFVERIADGVLDELEAVALAVGDGKHTAVLVTMDTLGAGRELLDPVRAEIAKRVGVDAESVFIHGTHTHTGPTLGWDGIENDLIKNYVAFLKTRLVDVAVAAVQDMKPAKMGVGTSEAKNVAFIRRYRMKDGSAKTNPGVNNPDIVAPIGITDERVHVLRFDREGAESLVLVNFANHPDVVGGCKISADWPGMTRRIVEQAIENTKCIFFNGAQGDVNHVNVHPKAGDFNDMFHDFDGCSRGYGHARHIARVVTGAVMSVYDKVEYKDVDSVRYMQRVVEIPSNMPTAEELPLAKKYHELHLAGKDEEIPFKAMMLTTVVAEAGRMVRLANGPAAFPMLFSAVGIGDVALFGIPGEPFNGVGRALKESKEWSEVLPCCLTNGSEGYFPMKDSYDEGGYEARSSNFKAGVAEKIIEIGLEILSELKK
jgi:hypothetical protein